MFVSQRLKYVFLNYVWLCWKMQSIRFRSNSKIYRNRFCFNLHLVSCLIRTFANGWKFLGNIHKCNISGKNTWLGTHNSNTGPFRNSIWYLLQSKQMSAFKCNIWWCVGCGVRFQFTWTQKLNFKISQQKGTCFFFFLEWKIFNARSSTLLMSENAADGFIT